MLRGRGFRLEREDDVMSIERMTCAFTVAVKCAWKTQVSELNVSNGISLIYRAEAGGGLLDNEGLRNYGEMGVKV